jgi:hypothetical protein
MIVVILPKIAALKKAVTEKKKKEKLHSTF